jgi:hypothetical protein
MAEQWQRLGLKSKLEWLACLIAIEAPLKPKVPYHGHIYLSWDRVNELRNEMKRRGFDWEALTKERIKIEQADRK